jgi:MFS transporter, PPP family, 3-phenylpropionic acid transporter
MQNKLKHFSIFYFFYYGALGAYTPYIGRWVDSLGFNGYVVGMMLVLWYGGRIIGPPLWNRWIEKSDRPGFWFVIGCFLTMLCFAGFTLTKTSSSLFIVMGLLAFFYNAVMPQFEAMTLAALGKDTHQYGRIRVWGSVGFLIVASSYGKLMDHFGSQSFPWLAIPLFVATVLAAWPHRLDPVPVMEKIGVSFSELWRRDGAPHFLFVVLLAQVSFGAFYVFYTLHLQAHGHDGAHIGILWGTGVLIEIAMFWQAPKLIAHFSANRLMIFCLLITAARWIVTAFYADSFVIMLLAQTTHAFGFALFHACCMHSMGALFPGRLAQGGQSLMFGFSSGVGGVIGAGLASMMWNINRGQSAFFASAAVSLLACAIYVFGRKKPRAIPTAF